MGQKVDKEGSGWTAGGIEQQDGAGRPCVWSPVTRKGAMRPHAHSRAGAWTAGCRLKAARGGTCGAGFRRGCHRRVDRPRAPRNLWFPAGEERPGKSPAAVTAAATAVTTAAAAARRRSGGGEGDRNETRSLKK